MKYLLMVVIVLEGLGGFFFILGSSLGVYLLVRILILEKIVCFFKNGYVVCDEDIILWFMFLNYIVVVLID